MRLWCKKYLLYVVGIEPTRTTTTKGRKSHLKYPKKKRENKNTLDSMNTNNIFS